MARMDKRLLETLRGIRVDSIHFEQKNPPAVSNLLIGLAQDLKMDPKMGMSVGRWCMCVFIFISEKKYSDPTCLSSIAN